MNELSRIQVLKNIIDNLIHLQEVEPDLYKNKEVTSRIEMYMTEYKTLKNPYVTNIRYKGE